MRCASTRVLTPAVLLAWVAFATGSSVVAQQATPRSDHDAELLATAPFDVPSAPTPIVLARITFASGAGLSMNANRGPDDANVATFGEEVTMADSIGRGAMVVPLSLMLWVTGDAGQDAAEGSPATRLGQPAPAA